MEKIYIIGIAIAVICCCFIGWAIYFGGSASMDSETGSNMFAIMMLCAMIMLVDGVVIGIYFLYTLIT